MRSRRGDTFTFTTDLGPLDILGSPIPTTGYEELLANAQEIDLDGHSVLICSLDDLIRMKEASGRPKDRVELEVLGGLQQELGEEER